VEALHELVATVPHEKQRLLFEALDLVGQLGLMAEMRRRIDIIIPGPEKALKGLGQNPVARNDALLTKLCESIRSFGKRGSTIPSHFEYPAHWRRTKATVNAMRLAETQLDAFWTAFDEHLQEDLGGHLHEHLSIEHRTVHWTLLWGDTLLKRREATPPAPAVVAGLSALTLEDASDGATSSLVVASSKKAKIKTRGVARQESTLLSNTIPPSTYYTRAVGDHRRLQTPTLNLPRAVPIPVLSGGAGQRDLLDRLPASHGSSRLHAGKAARLRMELRVDQKRGRCYDQTEHKFPRALRYTRDEAAVLVGEAVRTEADEGVWVGLEDICGEVSRDWMID